MALYTYAGDVECITCCAQPFEPCVYTWSPLNHKLKRVGQPIFRKGYRYYHNERQNDQRDFNYNYLFGPGCRDQLAAWLLRFGDIFSESK